MKKMKFQMTALVAMILLSACSGGESKENAEETTTDKPLVKLAQVRSRPVEQIMNYTATVEAEVKNNIAPSMPVRIASIYVEVGDRVRKGQRLVRMDAANLTQVKLQLENQKTEFKRIDELYKVGGVSKSDWEAVKTALDISESSYKNLLENTSLLSPLNGIVTARNYDKGDMYSGAQPILTVEQITPVKLLINVSELYFTKVQKGQPVKVKLDVYDEEVFEGKINLVYPTIDPATRTFPVEIRLNNRSMKVRPGMFARVTLNFGTRENLVVPDLAVIKQQGSGEYFVFEYKNGKVYRKVVELGRRMSDEYEVLSGIEDNTSLVVAGHTRLIDGVEVEVSK